MEFDEEFKENQRVAELASHLIKTGVVASSGEADKRAREMIYGNVQAQKKPAQAAETNAANIHTDNYMNALEMSHNLIMKEVGAIKYKQDQLLSEIISLKSELSKIQIQAALQRQNFAPVASAAPVQETKTEAPRGMNQEAASAAQSAPQAATQEVPKKKNPDDISIEKYFYFGNKK